MRWTECTCRRPRDGTGPIGDLTVLARRPAVVRGRLHRGPHRLDPARRQSRPPTPVRGTEPRSGGAPCPCSRHAIQPAGCGALRGGRARRAAGRGRVGLSKGADTTSLFRPGWWRHGPHRPRGRSCRHPAQGAVGRDGAVRAVPSPAAPPLTRVRRDRRRALRMGDGRARGVPTKAGTPAIRTAPDTEGGGPPGAQIATGDIIPSRSTHLIRSPGSVAPGGQGLDS